MSPGSPVFRRTDVHAEDLTIPVARHPDRHDRGLADHPAVDADLVVRRIDPEIPMLPGERAQPKRGDDRIELATDARDLGFGDPIQAERLHQIVDLARRDAVDVRLLDQGQQSLLRAPAGLE